MTFVCAKIAPCGGDKYRCTIQTTAQGLFCFTS